MGWVRKWGDNPQCMTPPLFGSVSADGSGGEEGEDDDDVSSAAVSAHLLPGLSSASPCLQREEEHSAVNLLHTPSPLILPHHNVFLHFPLFSSIRALALG